MPSRSALPILLLCLSLPLNAQAPLRSAGKITNGVTDHLHPNVGLFIVDGECSPTLIGCQTVLTAAHCLCELPNGEGVDGDARVARPAPVGPAGKCVVLQPAGIS